MKFEIGQRVICLRTKEEGIICDVVRPAPWSNPNAYLYCVILPSFQSGSWVGEDYLKLAITQPTKDQQEAIKSLVPRASSQQGTTTSIMI